MAMTENDCLERWQKLLAPETGNLQRELTLELAEYTGARLADIERQLDGAAARFTDEWRQRVRDPTDERAVVRFYNESQTELFDLASWHASDHIHYRTLFCVDMAVTRPGRECLDFGSGIGSDAIVMAAHGFQVTLADVSDPLRAFARWRCTRRGFTVADIDLKKAALPANAYDVVLCFDVLEHVHRPVAAVSRIRQSLRRDGLLFVHAPFGPDAERPMHLIHRDPITPRMRALGLEWQPALESRFPAWLWHPRVYEAAPTSRLERTGYLLHDAWLPGRVTQFLARQYRRLVPRRVHA